MKLCRIIPVLTALLAAGCVQTDLGIGASMLPESSRYLIITPDSIAINVSQLQADSLSGFSSTRVTIGAIRKDDQFGLTTRSSAVSLVPLFDETHDMGENRIFKSLHLSLALDSVSVADKGEAGILQQVNVYALSRPLDIAKDFNSNGSVEHGSALISEGSPVINGKDSLSIWFTADYGKQYLNADKYLDDFDSYMEAFPGIYMETPEPISQGGRINIFELKLKVDPNTKMLLGNYARLSYSAEYEGVRKDTSALFYLSPKRFYDLDSLSESAGSAMFPQYSLNLTGHESAGLEGGASAEIAVEGGGGLKPVVSASELREAALAAIAAESGSSPENVIINKATLNFNYINDSDPLFEKTYLLPQILSPTCRLHTSDTTVSFVGLSDTSSGEENKGDRNKSLFSFNPDITYHLQELIGMEADNPKLKDGSYDIWLLIMHNDRVTTSSGGSSDMSDYYQYLAYQSYMSDMYSGYGGYGGYGYGGYGGYGYSNYYNYAMLAQMYGQNSTTTKMSVNLDADRYYYCRLYGPGAAEKRLRPTLTFTYSIPKE